MTDPTPHTTLNVRSRVPLALLLFWTCLVPISAQTPDTSRFDQPIVDTSGYATLAVDSLGTDSIGVSPSGRDKPIVRVADRSLWDYQAEKLYLWGNADVEVGEDRLRAAYIEIDFASSELFARAELDSATGDYYGVPLLNYGGEELSALTLKYNFKTGRGVSTAAEIAIEDGLVRVDRFKRVAPDVVFAENGRFTTCDHPEPHFYFEADRMKLEGNDVIYADQMKLVIEDVPVLSLPVGFFFAMGGGRQSGLIIPSFRQSNSRGVELVDLGYFLILNDYLDTKLTTDLSSQGGYNFESYTRFRLRDRVSRSNLRLEYSLFRTNVDDPFEEIIEAEYEHTQDFGPSTNLTADLYYTNESDPIRKTTSEIGRTISEDEFEDITRRRVTSTAGFRSEVSPFGVKLPYFLQFNSERDIVTGAIPREQYIAEISPRPVTPFAQGDVEPLRTLSFSLRPRYTRLYSRDTVSEGVFRTTRDAQGISLSPSLSLSPKLGYFTISPRVSLNSSIFFRRQFRTQNDTGLIIDRFESGLHVPFWYSVGGNARTTLYGIVQPGIFGVEAIRHRLTPSVGFEYAPDFSDPSFGYYDTYVDTAGDIRTYSIFDADRSAAGVPGSGARRAITFGLENSFEAKLSRGDTLEPTKITILEASLNGGYNLADSVEPFDNIQARASTNFGSVGRLSANATLTPYEATGPGELQTPGRLLSFPYVRVTSASFNFNTTFSDDGFITQPLLDNASDSIGYRPYRDPRTGRQFDPDRFFGDRVRGDSDFGIPWSIALGGGYTLTPTDTTTMTSFNVNTTINLTLTPTTKLSASGNYDLNAGRFNIPTIRLEKDLHDWILTAFYSPSGFSEQFTISIGFKPALLRDFKQDFRF